MDEMDKMDAMDTTNVEKNSTNYKILQENLHM